MDEKILDDIKEEEEVKDEVTPIEVTIKKEIPPKEPDFDYDDYSPSDSEILEIEKEIQEKIEKRTNKVGT